VVPFIDSIMNRSSPVESKELVPITISSPAYQSAAEATVIDVAPIKALEVRTVHTLVGAIP